MTTALISRDRVEQEVRSALATTLRIDAETIDMGRSIVNDMHATSIDFLDVNFRLENAFGIQLATQLLLDHVEEELGEGKAIDRNNKITPAAAELLKIHFDDAPGIEVGMYADEVPSVVTPAVLVEGVVKILETLPEACTNCGAEDWKSEDGAKVQCAACGKDAVYPDGDELTKRWIHDVERDKQLFTNA